MSDTRTPPLSLKAVEIFSARVRQWGIRARDRVTDAELPQSREEAETFARANTDALRLLLILVRAASRGVDEFEAALADARHAHRAVSAWLAEADRQPTSIDCDYAALQERKGFAADVAAYRSARILLAAAVESASDPFRLLVAYVGRAVEITLQLDREVKGRRLYDALEESRKRLETIRRSAYEHTDLQVRWETRMGRRFSLPEIRE